LATNATKDEDDEVVEVEGKEQKKVENIEQL